MTGERKRNGDIAALGRLIDANGADRTRWPAPERLRFAHLIKTDAEARRMLAEAAALERVLDRAPRVPESRHQSLVEGIVAAAVKTPQVDAAAPATVTELAAARVHLARRGAPPRSVPSRQWQAAGLLAASLVLGILAGGTGLLQPAMQQIASIGANDLDRDVPHLAFGDARGLGADEETL